MHGDQQQQHQHQPAELQQEEQYQHQQPPQMTVITILSVIPEFWRQQPRLWFHQFSAIVDPQKSQWFDGITMSLGYESVYRHAVVIDAGTSGSRVLAYKFRVPLFRQPNLEEEFYDQSEPGLSAFADDPAKGADTIVQLIKKAEFLTPLEKRRSTPLIVRATAGLRLLPEEKARQLLLHVKAAVDKLGYDTRAGVEIMAESDEGIFIWYAINLLLNQIEGDTMAALDLGGGSTQITYQLEESNVTDVPAKDQHQVPTESANITVYTHSYLNLGLLAARHGIFEMEAGGNTSTEITSVCVEPIVSGEKWIYANVEYTISGASRPANMKPEAAFERCYKLVSKYVLNTLDWEPIEPPKGKVAAMNYFYDVAADAGLIDVMTGGSISVSAYRQAALRACGASNVEQPWACIDLSFCLALLQQAYKMPDHAPVSLFRKVNGHEVSWALGLAYNAVVNRIPETVKEILTPSPFHATYVGHEELNPQDRDTHRSLIVHYCRGREVRD